MYVCTYIHTICVYMYMYMYVYIYMCVNILKPVFRYEAGDGGRRYVAGGPDPSHCIDGYSATYPIRALCGYLFCIQLPSPLNTSHQGQATRAGLIHVLYESPGESSPPPTPPPSPTPIWSSHTTFRYAPLP